jgi:hypothetical protein
MASTITNLHLDDLPPLTRDNAIATTIRMASQATDDTRHRKRHTIQCTMGTKEYDTLLRQQCKPIHFSNKLLKHLAPLWETGVTDWHSILTKSHNPKETTTYHIQPTTATLAELPKGTRTSSPLQLQTALNTLRAILLQLVDTKYKKLPKDPTPNSTIIHPTWHKYMNTDDIPDHTPHSYATLTNNPSPITNAPSTIPKTHKRAGCLEGVCNLLVVEERQGSLVGDEVYI